MTKSSGRLWVFGYGSLMWHPAFHYVERRTARIHGFHCQFRLWSRGDPRMEALGWRVREFTR